MGIGVDKVSPPVGALNAISLGQISSVKPGLANFWENRQAVSGAGQRQKNG